MANNAINSLNYGSNTYTFTLPYGSCSTAAGTAAKTVDVDNFSLETGARVAVKFTVTNTAANPTLNVESTGAKAIYYNGGAITAGYLKANKTYEFVYNGTQWDLIGDVDTNTTYTNLKLGHGYCTCSTAAGTAAKTASLSSYTLTTGGIVAVRFTNGITVVSPTLNINSKGAKKIYYHGSELIDTGLIGAGDIVTFIYSSQYHIINIEKYSKTYKLIGDVTGEAIVDPEQETLSISTDIAASGVTAGTYVSANQTPSHGSTFNVPSLTIATDGRVTAATTKTVKLPSIPTATKDTAGVTIVYPEASCTTFSSDSGTITPLAAQKAAKMFAITRPPKKDTAQTVTANAVVRWENTSGDVKDSKITIEDVTNTKDTSKKANVLVIPAEGDKKMVYGYCTDQTDGTSFIGGVFPADATSYPYASGLAIGGTSGNLLWKGKKVVTSLSDLEVTATAAELNYVDGVTSNIQTQLNGKQATITGGATTIASSNLTASRALISNSSGKVAVSAVTSTELGYLDGVKSAIQTQLNAKAPLASPALTGNPTAPTQSAGNNSTRIATTAFVTTAITNAIGNAIAASY